MVGRRYEIDMSKGSIFKNMVSFAIPLVITNVLQLLYNAADSIVVGRWGGPECLAAVGSTGVFNSLLISLFIGLSTGVSVVIAKCYGAGDMKALERASHTSIAISVAGGLVAFVLGQSLCRPLLGFVGTPKELIDLSALYMRIIFIGVPAQFVFNFGAAILRSVGDTKRPLYILSVTGLINVVLNLILVIGFHMDVAGVAIATIVAHYLSAAAIMYILVFSDAPYRINIKKLKLYKKETKEIISVGLPAGIQSSVYGIANSAIQSAVNSFGAATMAGRTAAGSIESFVYSSMNAFYVATMTAVGHNYGAKQEKRIYKSMGCGFLCASVAGMVLGILTYIFAEPLLGIYISKDTADYATIIKEGTAYITVCGLPYFLCGIQDVFTGTLRGLGHSKIPMVNSLLGAFVVRIAWVIFVLPHNRQVWFLYLCIPIAWIFTITMHATNFMLVRKKTIEKMYSQQ